MLLLHRLAGMPTQISDRTQGQRNRFGLRHAQSLSLQLRSRPFFGLGTLNSQSFVARLLSSSTAAFLAFLDIASGRIAHRLPKLLVVLGRCGNANQHVRHVRSRFR